MDLFTAVKCFLQDIKYLEFIFSYFFEEGFEVLNTTFQASVHVKIVTVIVYYNVYHCQKVLVELLIYSKSYSSFSRIKNIYLLKIFIIITSPIAFDIAITNVKATLKHS